MSFITLFLLKSFTSKKQKRSLCTYAIIYYLCFLCPMLFVFYAQQEIKAAYTAGAALIEYFNGKEGILASQEVCEAFFFPSHRILVFFLRRENRSMLSFYLLLRIGYWYLFFEGWYPKRSHYPKRKKKKSFAYFS